jgi:hypothetical protein
MIFKITKPSRQINHNQWSEDTMIYPEVHVLAGTLVPLCLPTPRSSMDNRYHTPSFSKGATRTYQMVRSSDTSNPLELEFGAPPGNHNNPSQQAHRSRPRTITNMCWTSTAAPSHLGGGNHQEKQESRIKWTPKCQLDANSQTNAFETTQSRFD